MGLFLTLEEPTGPLTKEADTAGFYGPEHFQGRGIPKLQFLTIEALLAGMRPELPRFAPTATFKQAPRKKSDEKQGKPWQASGSRRADTSARPLRSRDVERRLPNAPKLAVRYRSHARTARKLRRWRPQGPMKRRRSCPGSVVCL